MRWALVRTEAVRPRAFVAPRWRWVPEGEAVEAVFTGAHARDAALVVLTGAGPPAPPDRDGLPLSPCRIDAYVPERIRLDCDSPAGGYAVLAEENAPGWSARVDGQAVALVAADVLLRAVAVPPGRHQVEFSYRTPQLRTGAVLSAISWAALLVLFWRRREASRTRTAEGALPASGSASCAA